MARHYPLILLCIFVFSSVVRCSSSGAPYYTIGDGGITADGGAVADGGVPGDGGVQGDGGSALPDGGAPQPDGGSMYDGGPVWWPDGGAIAPDGGALADGGASTTCSNITCGAASSCPDFSNCVSCCESYGDAGRRLTLWSCLSSSTGCANMTTCFTPCN